MATAKATIDHETIRNWVNAKGGCPAQVKETGGDGEVGIIRIDYPGFSGKESLEKITWEEFFEKFEESNLAFLYQDEEGSRFSKLVRRDSVEVEENRSPTAGASESTREAHVSNCSGMIIRK